MNTKLIFFPIFLITTIFPSSVNAIPEYQVNFEEIDCFEAVCCRRAMWSAPINGKKDKEERFYLVQSNKNITIHVLHDNETTEAKYEINGVASEDSLTYKTTSAQRVRVKVTPISEAGTVRFCLTGAGF